MADLVNRVRGCFFRRLSHLHSRRWGEIEQVLGSKGRLRLSLYLASYGPVSKSTLVDHLMKLGGYVDRGSCTRVVNRLLANMIEEGYVKMDEDGAVSLKRGRLMVGEYPGIWIALGPGASLVFLGLGYVENDSLLILCSLSFLLYTVAVVLHSLTRLSPF